MSSQAPRSFLKHSSILLRILLGLAVLALGAGIVRALVVTRPEPPIRPVSTNSLLVGTVPATSMDIPRQWRGYGTARSMNAVDVAAEVAGRVVERPSAIEPGMPVEAGALLARLESTDYLARVRAAQEAIVQASADLDALDVDEASWEEQLRLVEEQVVIERRELQQALAALESGAATSSEIDRRTKALRILEAQASRTRQELGRVPASRQALQATLARLRAEAEVAEENLRRTTITSPIEGVLQRVDVEAGELLTPGSPVARIVDLSRVEVPLRIPSSALGDVAVGDGVSLRPDAPSTREWSGAISRIAPEADQATRTLTVFVEVRQDPGAFREGPAESPLLLPGEFVVGTIVGAPERGRTVVPRRAVQEGALFIAEAGGQGVWIARRVPVDVLFHAGGEFPRIDPIERQWAVLETSLPEGVPVIVTNLDDLTDGAFVEQRARATAEERP